jgi:uncharacterized protein (TIGR03083 family)
MPPLPTHTQLPFPSYLTHLETESARFREVLEACDPAARVPACPDWDAADLLWHLTGVQRFWAGVVTNRPAEPTESGTEEAISNAARPEAHADLLAAFDAASAALQDALRAADPADAAWTWSEEQTVGFTFRRQSLEALIHRLDAEQAAGQVTALDPVLAADGVAEVIGVMYGGAPPWGRFEPWEQRLRLDLSDADTSVWVQLGLFSGTDPESGTTYTDETDLALVDDPGTEPDVVVTGTAEELLTWLWRRTDGAGVATSGDPEVYATFRGVVDQPLN